MRNKNPRVPYFVSIEPKLKDRYNILRARKLISPHAMQAEMSAAFLVTVEKAEELHKESSKPDVEESAKATESKQTGKGKSVIVPMTSSTESAKSGPQGAVLG